MKSNSDGRYRPKYQVHDHCLPVGSVDSEVLPQEVLSAGQPEHLGGVPSVEGNTAGGEHEIKRLEALGMWFAIFRNRKNVGADAFDCDGAQ